MMVVAAALCRELDNLAHIRQSVARLGAGARVELVHNAVSSSHEMVARAGGEQGNPGSNKVGTREEWEGNIEITSHLVDQK